MGAKLVGAVFAAEARRGGVLKPNEKLLLVFMAHTALDADTPPRYFGAREQSALAFGRMVPDQPSLGDPEFEAITRERAAAFARVKVAIQGLIQAGYIERQRRGREGQRAEFALRLTCGESQGRGTENVPLEGTENVPLSGTESDLSGVRKTYPQGRTKEPQGITPRETPDPALTHVQSVENRSKAA